MSFGLPKYIWVAHGHGEGSPQIVVLPLARSLAEEEYFGCPVGIGSGETADPTASSNFIGRIASKTLRPDGTLEPYVEVELFTPTSVLAAHQDVTGNNPFPKGFAKLTWTLSLRQLTLVSQEPPFNGSDIVVFVLGQAGPPHGSSIAELLFVPVRGWGLVSPSFVA